MSKKSVLGKPSAVAHLPKQGFNMSQKFKFTSAAGQLLPVYFDFLHPGEKIRFSVDLFTRTQPLSTAAMADIDEYVDLFFVPAQKLYSPFNELFMGISDFNSSLFDIQALTDSVDYIFPRLTLNSSTWRKADESGAYMPGVDAWVENGQTFDRYYYGAMRLCDHLGLNPYFITAPIGINDVGSGQSAYNYHESIYMPTINPMYFCAYQAIYYDYYRLSNWQANDNKAYNLDTYQSLGDILASGNSSKRGFIRKWFTLRYRPWQRDYFKAVEPSPIVNSLGLANFNYDWLDNGATISPNVQGLGPDISFSDSYGAFSGQTIADNDVPGVQNIKTMFAVQKMLAITGRAGKHYDDQVLAHYGFKVPRMATNEVYFLGSHHQQIHIGEVISTADTSEQDGSALGQIAGKGYGKAVSDVISFTAPLHGIIMAIYSCVPKLNYITNIDRLHTCLERFDYYTPELDKLGMLPIFQYELAPTHNTLGTSRMGWQYRYMPFKCKYDRTTNAFLKGNYYGTSSVVPQNGPFSDWSLTQYSYSKAYPTGQSALTWEDLYCVPSALDQIMLVGYDDNAQGLDQSASCIQLWRQMYTRDPLIHDLAIKCYKVSSMSTFGIDDLSAL